MKNNGVVFSAALAFVAAIALLILAAVLVLILMIKPAEAMPRCGPRATVLEQLAAEYHEVPIAVAAMKNGGLLEVVATVDGATFSIVVTSPKGWSCIATVGANWHAVEAVRGDGI